VTKIKALPSSRCIFSEGRGFGPGRLNKRRGGFVGQSNSGLVMSAVGDQHALDACRRENPCGLRRMRLAASGTPNFAGGEAAFQRVAAADVFVNQQRLINDRKSEMGFSGSSGLEKSSDAPASDDEAFSIAPEKR